MEHYKHKVKVISIQYSPIAVRALLLGRFLGFALCPSGKSNVRMKMNVGHWWNDTDSGNGIED
jgi:hypothetical protein